MANVVPRRGPSSSLRPRNLPFRQHIGNVTVGDGSQVFVGLNLASDADSESDRTLLLQSLYESDYKSHRNRNPQRAPGTCEWFLAHPRYISWKDTSESSILWVTADPGCGKSVLTSFLIDDLTNSLPSMTVCYFFFKEDNTEQDNVTSALRGILHQVFTAKPLAIKHAQPEFKSRGEKFSTEFDTLWLIFKRVVTECVDLIFLFDALDECRTANRETFVSQLIDLSKEVPVKLLFTSRPYPSIQDHFFEVPEVRFKAEDETSATDGDIEMVARRRVADFSKKRKLSAETREYLLQSLLDNADKTFLWMSLVLAEIEKSIRVSKRTLDSLLKELPKSIDAFYENALSKTPDEPFARRIFHIILGALRPLTTREIGIAIAVEPEIKAFEDLDLEPDPEDTVKSACVALVRVIDGKVYLVHQTAREFLIGSNTSGWKHSFSSHESSFIMLTICSNFLELSGFDDEPFEEIEDWEAINSGSDEAGGGTDSESDSNLDSNSDSESPSNSDSDQNSSAGVDSNSHSGSDSESGSRSTTDSMDEESDEGSDEDIITNKIIDEELETHFEKWGFLDYSARKFLLHLRGLENSAALAAFSTICDSSRNGFKSWLALFAAETMSEFIRFHHTMAPTPLMIASHAGLSLIVKLLLDQGADPNALDQRGNSALVYAIFGQGEIEEAVTETTTSGQKDVVGTESENRKHAIVRLLLEHGASLDYYTSNGYIKATGCYTLLHLAVEAADEGIIMLLLKHGASIDAKSRRKGKTPLFAACEGDHLNIATLLLKNGASVNETNKKGQTALHCAASWHFQDGSALIVKLLLENGAFHSPQDLEEQTPLHYAAGEDNDDAQITSLLLAAGAQVDARDLDQWTPLHSAAEAVFGNEAVVRALISRGANIEAETAKARCTPLHLAAQIGNEAMSNLLLEHGANVQHLDADGWSALHYAANYGNKEILTALLDAGIAIDSQEASSQKTALLMAVEEEHEEVVDILLKRGAKVNCKDKEDQTALHYAIQVDGLPLVKKLVDGGAELESQRLLDKRTALHLAADLGHVAILKILVEAGAKLDAKDVEGLTAEEAANLKEHKEAAAYLKEMHI